MKLVIEDVFCPKSLPKYTYIERIVPVHGPYEKQMSEALRIKGNLVIVAGASKSGKTVLCYKVLGHERLLPISGSQINTVDDFWNQLAESVSLPIETQINTASVSSNTIGVKVGGDGNIPLIAKLSVDGNTSVSYSDSNGTITKRALTHRDIINHIISSEKVILLDDFHYIDKDTQMKLARILKSEIFYGLKAIITTLPHRSDDAVRRNPDLIGRTSIIKIAAWSKEELSEIANKGFSLLNVNISSDKVEKISEECLASPQLMQENCLNIMRKLEESTANEISTDIIMEAFSKTAYGYEDTYDTIIKYIKNGPVQGRNKRKLYSYAEYNTGAIVQKDIYNLLLNVIMVDPPVLTLTLEEIKERMKRMLENSNSLPTSTNIIKPLKNIDTMMQEVAPQLDIISWKENQLFILDPFLLFYLRWNIA